MWSQTTSSIPSIPSIPSTPQDRAIPAMPQARARHIVQRMGESGQPPERAALAVNVGTQALLDGLTEEYLRPLAEGSGCSSFKLVQAPYGGGKTQFLHCLRERGWQLGFASALVTLSPDACAFDRAEAIYTEVARNLELAPHDLDANAPLGLDCLLAEVVRSRAQAHGAEVVLAWLRDDFQRVRIDCQPLHRAATRYMVAILDGDDDAAGVLGEFLRGEAVPIAELQPYRVREGVNGHNAFRFLRGLVQILRALDLPGLLLLFDEADRTMSVSLRRSRAIGDNLRQCIDACGQSGLPSVFWVYAVPPEFSTQIVPDYPALEQRLSGGWHGRSLIPTATVYDLDQIPLAAELLYRELADRLSELYGHGYAVDLEPAVQRENLGRLAKAFAAQQLQSGSRRTFVKKVVEVLHGQRREGVHRLSDAAIATLAGAAPLVSAATVVLADDEEFF